MKKNENYCEELTAYYDDVEKVIAELFGSFHRAANWFDKQPIELHRLWEYCKEKYVVGWNVCRTANEWYHKNVEPQVITSSATTAKTTALAVTPATPVTTKYSSNVYYYTKVEIDPEVEVVRAVRKEDWQFARLADRE